MRSKVQITPEVLDTMLFGRSQAISIIGARTVDGRYGPMIELDIEGDDVPPTDYCSIIYESFETLGGGTGQRFKEIIGVQVG